MRDGVSRTASHSRTSAKHTELPIRVLADSSSVVAANVHGKCNRSAKHPSLAPDSFLRYCSMHLRRSGL